jgi:uncharacterized protein
MQSDSSLEDYAQHLYQAWKIGQKGKNNGALLLVFTQEHKMRIHTGYGLEGPMPDVICKRIIEDEIAPHFKQGDFDEGLEAGVTAMMAAARGEYKGTGRTHKETQNHNGGSALPVLFVFVIIIFSILSKLRRRTATSYGSAGHQSWSQGWYFDTSSSSGGSWSSGGGGFSGGGDSGFSGGGGDSGGGGASGSW